MKKKPYLNIKVNNKPKEMRYIKLITSKGFEKIITKHQRNFIERLQQIKIY